MADDTAIKEPKKRTGRGGKGRPFEKGKSGNPAGRPKKDESMTDILRREMAKMTTEKAAGLSNRETKIAHREAMIKSAMRLAMKGDMTAFKYLFDRMDGPMRQELGLSGSINLIVDGDDGGL